MANAARLRDSTEIVLPAETFDEIGADLDADVPVTVSEEGSTVRLIGSPIAIERVSHRLARIGVSIP